MKSEAATAAAPPGGLCQSGTQNNEIFSLFGGT